jgi:copper(I)-binding protein
MKDGIMRMRPLARVPLPAGKPVELQGGTHVMLMELAHALRAGEQVPLRFVIEDRAGHRSHIDVTAPVRPLGQ